MEKELIIQPYTGAKLLQYLPQLARLRIEVFREYPYLYDGDLEYETKYLDTYIRSSGSVVVIAFDGDAVVGASTALPMAHETEAFKRPFIENGFDPDEVFYLGESVLLQPYRGRGAGVRFFLEREAHAARLGGFRFTAFCAVERSQSDPRRPPDYRPLDDFWRRRGYQKHNQLRTTISWRELGDTAESPHAMVYWLKALRQDT